MAIFTIPAEYELGLARLLTLSGDAVQELLSALESTTPSIHYRSIANKIALKVTNVSEDDLEDILNVLFALNVIRTGSEVPTEIFVDDICDSVNESNSEVLRAASARCEEFKGRLTRLLECKTLEIGSKAGVLLREHGSTYCSARVLSDVRPIFGESVEAVPEAAVIVHTLKITYHHGDELKDFFVAMNSRDVQRLRELLDRADAKGESLKSLLGASRTPYVDAE